MKTDKGGRVESDEKLEELSENKVVEVTVGPTDAQDNIQDITQTNDRKDDTPNNTAPNDAIRKDTTQNNADNLSISDTDSENDDIPDKLNLYALHTSYLLFGVRLLIVIINSIYSGLVIVQRKIQRVVDHSYVNLRNSQKFVNF